MEEQGSEQEREDEAQSHEGIGHGDFQAGKDQEPGDSACGVEEKAKEDKGLGEGLEERGQTHSVSGHLRHTVFHADLGQGREQNAEQNQGEDGQAHEEAPMVASATTARVRAPTTREMRSLRAKTTGSSFMLPRLACIHMRLTQ